MTDIAKQTLAITEKNLKASFEHARKLIEAEDINEVMRLQSEFLRTQFAANTGFGFKGARKNFDMDHRGAVLYVRHDAGPVCRSPG